MFLIIYVLLCLWEGQRHRNPYCTHKRIRYYYYTRKKFPHLTPWIPHSVQIVSGQRSNVDCASIVIYNKEKLQFYFQIIFPSLPVIMIQKMFFDFFLQIRNKLSNLYLIDEDLYISEIYIQLYQSTYIFMCNHNHGHFSQMFQFFSQIISSLLKIFYLAHKPHVFRSWANLFVTNGSKLFSVFIAYR